MRSLLAILVLTGCDFASETPTDIAKRSDFVVLANVDTNSGAVLYRMERLISGRSGATFPIASNGVLPGPKPQIEPNHSYGEQALVFLSARDGRLRETMSQVFIKGRAVGTDEPLEVIIGKVKSASESGARK